MIINKQLLSIPPYISTSWKDVELLLSDGHHSLNIYLKNGTLVKISQLLKEHLDLIFSVHQEILLQKTQELALPLIDPMLLQFTGPFLEHDPELADASPLPDEIKYKLKSLFQGFPKIDTARLHPAHADCFCPHCQLMNLIVADNDPEEFIEDSELQFATWKMEELSLHNFKLTHPYNDDESYIVSLNEPVSCSCEQTNCEHLMYVLRN